MIIAVFGATGNTGTLVVEYAIKQGHQVQALARDPSKLQKIPVSPRVGATAVLHPSHLFDFCHACNFCLAYNFCHPCNFCHAFNFSHPYNFCIASPETRRSKILYGNSEMVRAVRVCVCMDGWWRWCMYGWMDGGYMDGWWRWRGRIGRWFPACVQQPSESKPGT